MEEGWGLGMAKEEKGGGMKNGEGIEEEMEEVGEILDNRVTRQVEEVVAGAAVRRRKGMGDGRRWGGMEE